MLWRVVVNQPLSSGTSALAVSSSESDNKDGQVGIFQACLLAFEPVSVKKRVE